MEIKFDAAAAEVLLQEMQKYCSSIQKEARDILDIVNSSDKWNDNQNQAFQNNVYELAKDLNKTLSFESEYMRTFYERVVELKG